jgi:hypothetical protein
MSQTILEFTLNLNGSPADPDNQSVLFGDQTSTYAVNRDDTGAAVTPPTVGSAMTRVSAGVYQYTISDPATGLYYDWWINYKVNGAQRYRKFTTPGSGTATQRSLALQFTTGTVSAVSLITFTDTSGNTVPGFISPAAMTPTGGYWIYSFIGTAPVYEFSYNVTDGSGNTLGPFYGRINRSGGYQGRYINTTILNQYLGSMNVQIEGDTNSTGVGDPAAVQQCIMAAEDEADNILGSSPTGIVVPLQFTGGINSQFQVAVCQLASADLADKRLITTATRKMMPWSNQREVATNWLKSVWYGDRKMTTAAYKPPASGPVGRIASVNSIGLPIFPNGTPAWWSAAYEFGWSSAYVNYGWNYWWW